MALLRLKVVTPERSLVDEEVENVQVPGLGGYLGILPGHAPLFSELAVGALSYTQSGQTSWLAVSGGFVEVLDDEVRVLADVAEAAHEIDVARAENARARAAERTSGGGETDYARAQAAERRSSVRLDVAGRRTGR